MSLDLDSGAKRPNIGKSAIIQVPHRTVSVTNPQYVRTLSYGQIRDNCEMQSRGRKGGGQELNFKNVDQIYQGKTEEPVSAINYYKSLTLHKANLIPYEITGIRKKNLTEGLISR